MTAYLAGKSDNHVWINADDTTGRRSRAAQINAERRRYEQEHGVRLTLMSASYDEMHGFLSRSAFRYSIAPA